MLKANGSSALGDPETLHQVLLSLLDNSMKYSTGPITVSVLPLHDNIRIGVHDNGPGIDPEVLAHVFERFYRGPTDIHLPGFGLGLPIAKTLVEAQGGEIFIESGPKGSTVWISLPAA